MRYLLVLMMLICSNAFAGFKVSSGDLLVPAGNVGVGSATPREKLDVDGAVYATAYYGSGANLTGVSSADIYWTGTATNLVAATGRTSLEMGSIYPLNAGTMTDAQWCKYNSAGTSISCDVAPVVDTNTTYTATGTLLNLTGTVFKVNEGTLTNGKLCTYVTGTGLVCNNDVVTDTDTTYTASTGITLTGTAFSSKDSEIVHDNLSGFVANEHIDWTSDQGATNIHAGNYTDTNTTYTATANQGLLLTSSTQFGIQDCAANQIMKRNAGDTAWECAADATGAGGGYTNLTEFVDQGNWKVFYSDGSGDVKELTTGAYGYALMGQGTTSAPAFVDMAIYALDSDLTGYVPTSRTVNGKALSSNITLTPYDIDMAIYALDTDLAGYVPTSRTVNGKALSSNITLTQYDVDLSLYAPKASPTFTGNVGIGAAAGAKLGVDGAIYAGSGTPSPTWGGVSMASAGDAYFMGDLEVDGTIYTDATGDTLLNVTGGNVGIGTANALAQLHIDGTIYSQNLTVGGSHGAAKLLCLGIDGVIYGVSSGGCF